LKMALCFEIFISGVKFPFPLWSDSGESHSEALAETSHRTIACKQPTHFILIACVVTTLYVIRRTLSYL